MVPRLSSPATIVSSVNAVLESDIAQVFSAMQEQSAFAPTLTDPISAFIRGGKRVRALATWWGYELAAAPGEVDAAGIARAAASVEMLHAAALIHDDIIDDAETRRGEPATHAHFRDLHSSQSFPGRAELYGTGAAIIAGDLCLVLSERLYDSARLPGGTSAAAIAAHTALREDVMLGQFLDIHLQAKPVRAAEIADRAMEVLTYKSAKYSVEQPLLLGAALGGGSDSLLEELSAFGLPLGQAFQLRDDYLGVFGDPAITGKPAGDDLREGKKTVLLGYTLTNLEAAGRHQDAGWLSAAVGNPDLSAADVERIHELMRSSGAVQKFEALIANRLETAEAALAGLAGGSVAAEDLEVLRAYAAKLTRRDS